MEKETLKIKNVTLKNGAVIIADVHYKKGGKEFIEILKKWVKNPPVQVFLLGDIFHLLLPFDFLIDYNKDAINLINILSKKTEVYFTFGNHDFEIESLFRGVVFADVFIDKQKGVFLTHGDLTDSDKNYKFYVKIIRNVLFMKFLNIISLNFINNWVFKVILNKKIECNKIKNFKNRIKSKLNLIDYGIIIEGHYHQNVILRFFDKIYINVPAFICTKSYILIQLDNNPIIKEINYDGR